MRGCHSAEFTPTTWLLVSAVLQYLGLASCLSGGGNSVLWPLPHSLHGPFAPDPGQTWGYEPTAKLPPGPACTSPSPWVCSLRKPTRFPGPATPAPRRATSPLEGQHQKAEKERVVLRHLGLCLSP